jgi:DGQHR domain-containing protein
MTTLKGEKLEDLGKGVFERIGLICINRLEHVRLLDIDPEGPYSSSEHLEFDFLIPYQNTCLIGEITARKDPSDTRKKYNRFRRHYDVIRGLEWDEKLWAALGVTRNKLRRFREIEEIKGFFITTLLQRFDVDLSSVSNIARFYRIDWDLIVEYSESVGGYAQHHFLDIFHIQDSIPHHALMLSSAAHKLVRIPKKKIASGDVGLADVYTFEISPYDLLPIAKVYRRDELPNLSLASAEDYQRPLLPVKLKDIRHKLLKEPEFIFPNSILVVLSTECHLDEKGTLYIPQDYGALSVIDGQHRLFSYADENVEKKLGGESRIMVTAIQFPDATGEIIQKYSAKTFVEINTNQTRVSRQHLDAIAYPILGETTPRAIAAQIILQSNERKGKLHGFFETTQTGLGIIRAATVLSALKTITSIRKIKRLQSAQRGSRLKKKQGYENLFGEKVEKLTDADTLIRRGVVCFEHYFNLVARVFFHDWPERGQEKGTALEYAKMIAGFVKLLRLFSEEGLDWKCVEVELKSIRANVLELRGLQEYDRILFDSSYEDIPDSLPSDHDDYRFLEANRREPTTIKKWL